LPSLHRALTPHLLRRAILLHEKLRQLAPGLRRIRDGVPSLEIDARVLAAFLDVKEFNHGARSIEAILRMSGLGERTERFELASLPPDDQLGMHADAREFRDCLQDLGL
jgi:hypothetical protein